MQLPPTILNNFYIRGKIMAQFPLLMNGAEVCTLEDLKRNFDPNVLLEYRKRFAAWLKGWDYDEEAVEVKALDQDLTDDQWLKAICEIIGISDQELAASKKKNEAAAKLEQEKIVIQHAEEQKRKIEQERKKKIVPTPENIQVTINNKKSPFCDPVTDVFVCEKGVMVNTKSDQLYFSKDGEHFTPIVPNSKSYHYYKNFSYLNGYLVFQDSVLVYFSQDGHEWDSFDFEDILPAGSKDYDSPNYKVLPSIENIVYNNNRKSFTIFYSFNRDVGVGNDITKIYCMSTASKLDGSWTDWGEINSFPFLEPGKFYWTQGKYFTSVSWGQEKYGYNAKYDNGVYFSEDGLKWTQAEESDKNWLDGLEVEDSNTWMHIDYCNCKDGQMRYFLEEAKIIPWREIYFSHGDDTIKAWKEDFERQPVSEECDFTIKTVVCFNDKLLIFGENNEFAIGEIRVKG